MTALTEKRGGNIWRILGWGGAVGLILTPLVAMQFTREVNWTASDFVFATVMLGGLGLAFELVARRSRNVAYRAGAVAAILAVFFLIWVNGAVGVIGNEDNPANLLFAIPIALAFCGALLARFQARGMAIAMLAAVAAHIGIAGYAVYAGWGDVRPILFMGTPWLIAAGLFGLAARENA